MYVYVYICIYTYKGYIRVLSKIIFYLLQDGCKSSARDRLLPLHEMFIYPTAIKRLKAV